ncbi:hypothetical protein C4K08_4396 [Pseudomonas chlororaphis subsp. aureofaciens]|nr:hypothetical protein C4K08_4396 [Pseudomonas chlororaphis subsp. aureofaciens]
MPAINRPGTTYPLIDRPGLLRRLRRRSQPAAAATKAAPSPQGL